MKKPNIIKVTLKIGRMVHVTVAVTKNIKIAAWNISLNNLWLFKMSNFSVNEYIKTLGYSLINFHTFLFKY